MNNLLQPGHHPDAEQLSAFTDHALPPHEQQQMLAHLNTCRDCRNRVYLAQQINAVESLKSTSAAIPRSRPSGWFTGWRLAFPAVALACLILLTLYLRKAPAPRNQALPNNTASNAPAQAPLPAAPAKPLAAPASPASASPKSAPIPRPRRPQPIAPQQTTTAAAAPPAPTLPATPLVPRPPQSATASAVNNGGGIQGTITDLKGDGVPKAQVIATNTDTGIQTTKLTTNAGTYSIAALEPGPYNVEVVAPGFQRLLQENVTIDRNQLLGLNLKLPIGGENTTVTVTDAPPFIDTTSSTLGGTIENDLYTNLPITMNGAARDPTAFQYLMPGVQEKPTDNNGTGANSGNSGIYGGTGQTNLNENYIEGVPASNIARQGSRAPAPLARTKPLPTLPSKLPALSVVERAGRTLAIDTAGTLFRSDDAGVTWQLVPTQWQGRALTLHLAQPPSAPQPQAATNTAEASRPSPSPIPPFELTTDSGARYLSSDGLTWQRR